MQGKLYGVTSEGVSVIAFTLKNKRGITMSVINYGCTITSLIVPDRHGHFEDIVLGYDSLESYMESTHYLGSIIGRHANRIAFGNFILDEKTISVAKNLFPHHLHGGNKGFDKAIWNAVEFANEEGCGVDFYYQSMDGEEGFPGNLDVHVRYFLRHDDSLSFEYYATTDKKTIINLTQHCYFNLNPGSADILNHELTLHASQFLPVDESLIPTGEIRSVNGTPFDFRNPKLIGDDISNEDEQLKLAHGYDHNFILDGDVTVFKHAASLHDPASGRRMDVYTTEPGIQLYTGNFLNNSVPGKNATEYAPYAGLCLETQHFPDSPHHPEFPTIELNPAEEFRSKTMLKFSIQK